MSASLNASGVVAHDDQALRDFERIYREQGTYVLKLLLRLGMSRSIAEDLAHDVFELLFLKLPEMALEERRSVAAMRAYLFRVTWNRAANHRRLHAVRNERAVEDPPDVPAAARAHDHVLARELARHLAKLTAQQVAVFVGFEVFGMTALELAEEQCLDERVVRRILADARKALRRSVNPPAGGDER